MARESQKVPEVNRPSNLLSDDENSLVFNLIGKRCATLSTTVVQVFKSGVGGQIRWQKLCVGVICFIKDNQKKSYYIRVFDLTVNNMIWEQEIYNQFKYYAPQHYFHSFEADNFVAGLNFADPQEANHFRQKVEEKLRAKEQRKTERRGTTVKREAPTNRGVAQPVNYNTQSVVATSVAPTISPSPSSNDLKKKEKPGKKKVKLSKEDIGTPSDFRHVGHVRWGPKGGFDINNIDPQWRKLFDTIGVTEKQLEDEETSKFIYEFVESHGGIEKATKELEKSGNADGAPPPPARSAAPTPPPSRGVPPRGQAPPIPQSIERETTVKGPPVCRAPPPPPPPAASSRTGPPPPQQVSRGPPPPPQMSAPPLLSPLNIPAPCPQPRVWGAGTLPLSPFPRKLLTAQPAKQDLFDQVHQGRQLTKVEPQQKEAGDGKDDLLIANCLGAQLKASLQLNHTSVADNDQGVEGAEELVLYSDHIQKSAPLAHRSKTIKEISQLKGLSCYNSDEAINSNYDNDVDPVFKCPITLKVMVDPVVAADGFTYEKEAIMSWFSKGRKTSPKTNLPLSHTELIPNWSLKYIIEMFVRS